MNKVSVLITTYNHAAFVEATLRSVLQQTYRNLELVVGDDGSTDGTQETLSRIAAENANVVLLLSSKNRGVSANWNRTLEACSGEYIATLSGDDLMLPEKIARQVQYLEEHRDYGLCTHDMEVFESQSGQRLYLLSDRFKMREGGIELAFSTNWFFGPQVKSIGSSILARACFLTAHRFDERLRVWNEWLHLIECLATSGLRWGHLSQVLGSYRKHSTQLTNSVETQHISMEEAMLVLSIADLRYPQLTDLIKNKRDFLRFQHLLFDWYAPEKRADYERQFRRDAGWLKWIYLQVVRPMTRSQKILSTTRPMRRLLHRLLDSQKNDKVENIANRIQ